MRPCKPGWHSGQSDIRLQRFSVFQSRAHLAFLIRSHRHHTRQPVAASRRCCIWCRVRRTKMVKRKEPHGVALFHYNHNSSKMSFICFFLFLDVLSILFMKFTQKSIRILNHFNASINSFSSINFISL